MLPVRADTRHADTRHAPLVEETPATLHVGLVGRGIQSSRTPAMQRAAGAAMGLDLRYDLLDVDALGPTTLREVIDTAERKGFAGLNVTFPFKRDVVALVDDLSGTAKRVGAVNTVVFRDGRRHGHNTDMWGFAEGFRRGLPDGKRDFVLLIGAGGAGNAVARALLDAGTGRILVADDHPDAAVALVESLNAERAGVAAVVRDLECAATAADGIVNATPMGMAAHPGMAIAPDLIEPRHWVADVVYFPLETALLRQARETGCRTLNGAGMAVFQAVRAFELFTGLTPDPDRMWAAFNACNGKTAA